MKVRNNEARLIILGDHDRKRKATRLMPSVDDSVTDIDDSDVRAVRAVRRMVAKGKRRIVIVEDVAKVKKPEKKEPKKEDKPPTFGGLKA